nr:hypothetical protein [Pseudomonas rustica]
MPHRGSIFWMWADCELHHRTHSEVLDGGIVIDVQVRLSRKGATQLFVGVYSKELEIIHEEAYTERPGETMTTALLWGVGKARCLAAEAVAPRDHRLIHANAPVSRRPRAT